MTHTPPEEEKSKKGLPFNEWGHTSTQYEDVWNELSDELIKESSDYDLYKYLTRVTSSILFNAGHPQPNYPYELLSSNRAVVLAVIRFLIIEGYIELTEKGTKQVTGEEVAPEPPKPPTDQFGGNYL